MKLHVMLLLVVAVIATAKAYGENLDQYYGSPEPECSRAGGQCILKSQCDGQLAESNLCPKQRSSGFECCHGLPKSENRCHKFGGECFEKNYCKKPFLRATDCGVSKECCILL